MKRFIVFVLLAGALSSGLAGQTASVVRQNDAFISDLKVLESWIRQQMAYRNLPGAAIGIVYDQELVYARGFGYADVEKKTPVTPKTLFRIASNSKTFTATAVMQLRDAGKLRLDDPVEKYLPDFSIQSPFPDAPPVTLFNLLTHTSGLPREAGFPYWTDRRFPTMKEILKSLPEQEMIYPPGVRIKYSNLGMALLGEVVAVVSGMPYDRYIRENIFRPLGMHRSSVFLTDKDKKLLAVPYSHRFPDGSRLVMPFTEAKGLASAANITSSLEDLARFVSLQFRTGKAGGSQILDGYTLAEMHRLHFINKEWTGGYGLGFRVWRDGDYTVVGHGGWVAGNRSQISFIPDEKIGVIVLTNADDASPSFFATRILETLVPVIHDLATPTAPVKNIDPRWEKYTGIYTDLSWYDTEILIYKKHLVMNGFNYPPDDDPEADLMVLYPAGRDTFRMSGPHGNGEKVVFIMDKNDRVVKVKVGENYIFPEDPGLHGFKRLDGLDKREKRE